MALTGRQDYYIDQSGESVFSPICNDCKHQHIDGITCDAFPERILKGVLTGELDHTKSLPGDNGIMFEPKLELVTDSLL